MFDFKIQLPEISRFGKKKSAKKKCAKIALIAALSLAPIIFENKDGKFTYASLAVAVEKNTDENGKCEKFNLSIPGISVISDRAKKCIKKMKKKSCKKVPPEEIVLDVNGEEKVD